MLNVITRREPGAVGGCPKARRAKPKRTTRASFITVRLQLLKKEKFSRTPFSFWLLFVFWICDDETNLLMKLRSGWTSFAFGVATAQKNELWDRDFLFVFLLTFSLWWSSGERHFWWVFCSLIFVRREIINLFYFWGGNSPKVCTLRSTLFFVFFWFKKKEKLVFRCKAETKPLKFVFGKIRFQCFFLLFHFKVFLCFCVFSPTPPRWVFLGKGLNLGKSSLLSGPQFFLPNKKTFWENFNTAHEKKQLVGQG